MLIARTDKQNPSRKVVSSNDLQKIKAEIARTGIGAATLLKLQREYCPEGLNVNVIYSWFRQDRNGVGTKTAWTDHLDFILNAWKQYPDAPVVAKKEISGDMIRKIQAEVKRTGIGIPALLKQDRENVPKGLTAPIVYSWLYGKTKTAQLDYLEYISQAWDKYPDNYVAERVPITDDIIQKIRAEIQRTRVGVSILLKESKGNAPEGLNATIVNNWLQNPQSRIKTGRKDYLDYLLDVWKAYPDIETSYEKVIGKDAKEVSITSGIVSVLKAHMRRTGISATMLLKNHSNIPEGLTTAEIISWLDKHGGVKVTQKRYLDFVLQCWEAEPDTRKGRAKNPLRVPLTKETAQKLKDEAVRTGIPQTRLLRIFAKNCPKGLNAHLISQWTNRYVKTANADMLEYVLHCWGQLPDRQIAEPKIKSHSKKAATTGDTDTTSNRQDLYKSKKAPYKGRGDWPTEENTAKQYEDLRYATLKPISVKQFNRLKYYREQYGLLPTKLFKIVQEPPPQGLNSYIVQNWLSKNTKRADPEHINWVLKRCEEWETVQE